MTKKKIILIVPTLSGGGAERVLSFIANTIDSNKFESVLAVAGFKKDSVYSYPKKSTFFFNKPRVLTSIIPLYKFIRKQKPDIVMGCMGHVNALIGIYSFFLPKKIKFVGRLASVVSVMNKFEIVQQNWFSKRVEKITLKRLDSVICQSKDMKDDFIQNHGFSEKKLVIINNPITSIPNEIRKHDTTKDIVRFITVGRLNQEKGHLRILDALSKIESYNFSYTIVGDGPLKEQIFESAKKLGLSSKINHINYTSKVNETLAQHDIFLQGSYVEGFPNAVLESSVVGVPILAFNVPGGTKEIITDGVNGYLAKNEEEYELHLKHIGKFTELNPEEISKTTIEKFSSDKILKQYEQVFLDLLD